MLASEFFFAPSLPFLPPSHRRRRRGRRDAFRTSLPRLSLGVVAKRFLSFSLSLSLSLSLFLSPSVFPSFPPPTARPPSTPSTDSFAPSASSAVPRPRFERLLINVLLFGGRLYQPLLFVGLFVVSTTPPLCPAPMDPPWTPSRYTLGGADEWRETIRASFSFSLATSCLPSFDAGCAPVLFSPRLLFLLPTWLLVVTLII